MSSSDCWAVGSYWVYHGYTNFYYTLAAQWNGTSWTQVTTPNPASGEFQINELNSVTCVASDDCWAVGQYQGYSLAPSLTLHWNGTAWSQVLTPDDSEFNGGTLNSVTCLSSSDCWAVGTNPVSVETGDPTGGSQNFVLNWNGFEWVEVATPNPSQPDVLEGSACSGSVGCWFVGYQRVDGEDLPLAIQGSNSAPYSVTPDGSALAGDQWGGGGGADTLCNCSSGDPVNLATGDYYESQTDLTIPGAGIPLNFTRTYDADAAQAEETASATATPLGYGWSDNLGMSVSYGGGMATVTQANGSQIAFQYYTTGATEPVGSNDVTWCPSDASAGVWCPTAPRFIATLTGALGGTGGPWTFTNDLKSPITYSFNTSGVLTEIADAEGDTLVSSGYSPGTGQASCATGDTCTAWASYPDGESSPSATLVEAFNSSSQLASVFNAASAASTQTASFSFSGSCDGSLTELCSATDPGSLTTTFGYSGTAVSSPYQYDMTTFDPPTTGEVTNSYCPSTGLSYCELGQLTEQVISTGATNQEQKFAYAANSTVTDGAQTQVTDYPGGSGGGTTTAMYVFSNGVEVGETDGDGATTYANPDPATLLPEDAIDGNGSDTNHAFDNYALSGTLTTSADVTQTTDGVGNVTETLYTSANLPWCSVDAADYANGTTCPGIEPSTPPTAGTAIGYTLTIYNSANEPTYVTDPLGNTTANSYTTAGSGVPIGLLYCTVDPTAYAKGSISCPAYGASHVTGTTTKTFDANGDVLTSTDADGDTTLYTYGSAANPGLPTVTTDPNGKVTTDTYNAEGEVTTQVVTDTSSTYSATTANAYDSAGRKWCEVDPYEYAQSIRCPSSEPTSPPTGTPGYTDTIYNSNGQVISTTNPIGGTTQYAYDGSGNKYCTVSPANYAASVRCPTSLPLTTPTPGSDSYLGATIDTFDADNQVTQVTNPLGGITANVYDSAGNLTSQTTKSNNTTSAPNVVTTTTYDADNRATSTTVDPGGGSLAQTSLTSYDPNGNAFCTVSANAYAAGSSSYQCPSWQPSWIATPPSPAGSTPLYSTSPTSAQANNVTTTFFNADGTQVQTTNPDVQTTVTEVDPDQRTYCTSDPTNVASWLAAHTSGPSSLYPYLCPGTPPTSPPTGVTGYTATIYDYAGRTLSTTDQLGNATSYTYDPAGNTLTTTNPSGKVTTNCYYGESGGCTASAPAGGGSFDDLYSTTTPTTSADPSGEVTTYQYYSGDQVGITTTPGGSTWDIYDANGDLAYDAPYSDQSGYTPASQVTTTFNVDGTRHTMTDATGTTTYGYDANGDVTSQALSHGSGTGLSDSNVDYSYYTTGVLASTTYPSYTGHSSPAVDYDYDATGAMTSETDWLGNEVTFAHDADNNSTGQDNDVSTSHTSGTSATTFSYDNADEASGASSTISCSGTNGTLSQSFSGSTGSRNPDGQLTEATDSYSGSCVGPSATETNYSYDQAGRVTFQGSTAQGSSPANVAYDAASDPTTLSNHASSGGSLDTYTQTFDNAGEVQGQTPISGSGGSSSTYASDSLGDLKTATTGSATTTYGYTQLGQMASTSQTGSSYLYTGDGLEAAQYPAPTWSSAATIDSTKNINSVSCVSTTFCMAVAMGGEVLVYSGSSWSSVNTIDGTHTLESVSCVSTSWCMAVDNDGQDLVTSNGGMSWTTYNPDGTKTMNSVSCVSTTWCAAVDSSGQALITTNGGSSWSTDSTASSHTLLSVSCVSSSFCMAVGGSGKAVAYTSSGWGTAASIDGSTELMGVSCSSTSFCMAVANGGGAVEYTGSWLSPTTIDGSTTVIGVSCTIADTCEAVDHSGNALTYDGGWSSTTNIDGTKVLYSVSCTSSTFCAATDNSGHGQELTTGSPTSQLTWDTNSSLPLVLSDVTNDYIYGPNNEPVEQVSLSGSTPTYLTYSPSNSTWLATNNSGNQVDFWGYDAFGNLAFGTPDSPFGYSGQYTDAATGLVNDRARFYQPQTGGFTTRDPAFGATDTAYTYAGGDPVNGSDPSGEWSVSIPVSPGATSNGFGFTWQSGENFVASLYPGSTQRFSLNTTYGYRQVDVYNNGWLNEVKTGSQSLSTGSPQSVPAKSTSNQLQIDKDRQLLNVGSGSAKNTFTYPVSGDTWWFLPNTTNPTTAPGQTNASGPLLDALAKASINVVLVYVNPDYYGGPTCATSGSLNQNGARRANNLASELNSASANATYQANLNYTDGNLW